jgi:hypothetical protein
MIQVDLSVIQEVGRGRVTAPNGASVDVSILVGGALVFPAPADDTSGRVLAIDDQFVVMVTPPKDRDSIWWDVDVYDGPIMAVMSGPSRDHALAAAIFYAHDAMSQDDPNVARLRAMDTHPTQPAPVVLVMGHDPLTGETVARNDQEAGHVSSGS